jgi:hypothetical protein
MGLAVLFKGTTEFHPIPNPVNQDFKAHEDDRFCVLATIQSID